jgi:hypothetical protein
MAIPSNIDKCPRCDTDLDRGYINFFAHLKWRKDKSKWWELFPGGQLLAGKNWGDLSRSTEALICSECKLVMFVSDYM